MESLLVAVGHVYDLITYIYTVIAVHLADFVNCDDVAAMYAQDAEKSSADNLRQLAEDFKMLFCIPWTHHQKIIDKVNGDTDYARIVVTC